MPNLPLLPDATQTGGQKEVTKNRFLSLKDFSADRPSTQWLWQGYIARENITLLTSQWKTGKTTLLAALLAQLRTGGELGGLAVTPGRAIVVSEEAMSLWSERSSKQDLGDHAWLCRPYRCCLDQSAWLELMADLATAHKADPVDLIVIDPLSAFLPGYAENDIFRLKPILAGLRDLCDLGIGLLLLHHPRKGVVRAGQASRGSGLLTSFVDIIIEMFPYRMADEEDRRRRLQAYSRHPDTPLQWVVELNAEGTHYKGQGDVRTSDYLHDWPTVRQLLLEAKHKLTIDELLESWPPSYRKPPYQTLWRWLERAVVEGLLCKRGTGRKGEPNRYWLPGQEEEWQKDPFYTPSIDEIMESAMKMTFGRNG